MHMSLRVALVSVSSAMLATLPATSALAAPTPSANCIGAVNSGGAQGGFASGAATSLLPGEFGAMTSQALGGPHGLIGVIASSNNCG
jgi:hypothetical protein